MARASAASKGHNWRLKVFTRALTKMEGNSIPHYEPVHFDIIIIYMNFHRLNCPCLAKHFRLQREYYSHTQQIQFHLCNKYKFTLQQILYHKWTVGSVTERTQKDEDCWVFLPVVRVWVGCCGHTRGNSCYPPQDRPFSWVVDVSG